jgi:hypothetical protein
VNGKSGWRYGKSGKCYTGKDAKRKAYIQRAAIINSGYEEGKSLSDDELGDALDIIQNINKE